MHSLCEPGQARRRLSHSGDVGNRAVDLRQAGVPGPARGIEQQTSLRGLKGPVPQVLEDATDDSGFFTFIGQ
jgi:hypothetical protein